MKEKVKMTPEVFYILGSSMEINQISFRNLGKVSEVYNFLYIDMCIRKEMATHSSILA